MGVMQSMKAQTLEETIEWLSSKKQLCGLRGSSKELRGSSMNDKIEFAKDYIVVWYSEKAYTKLYWSDSKEIVNDDVSVTLIVYQLKEDKNSVIVLSGNGCQYDKLKKAFVNMANLAGAKLIKEDLF